MAPREPTPKEIFDLFAADEPEDLRHSYLFRAREGQTLLAGSTAQSLVPEFRTLSTGLAIPTGAIAPQPIDFIKTYVSIHDYAFPRRNDAADVAELIKLASSMGTFRQRITDAAALCHFAHRPEDMAKLANDYPRFLATDMGERFRNTMRRQEGGPERIFLSRQAVLLAMREIFDHRDADEPPGSNSLVTAIALVHAVGTTLYDEPDPGDTESLAGLPSGLTMEFIQNELFYRSDDPLSLLYRHYAMWTKYGERVMRTIPRRKPMDLLSEATGLDVIDWIGFGFTIWAYRNAWDQDRPIWMPRSYLANADQTDLDRFLELVAANAEQFANLFGDSDGPWEFLPLQRRPILEDEGDYLLLDEALLLERVTSGLYWEVHDHEKREHGEDARRLWTQTYAEMLELYVIDILTRLAPPIVGGGKSIYSEDQMREAFEGKVCDAGVDFGVDFCAVEVVSGQVKTGTRIKGEQADFEGDTERLVLKKARQLHETARSIIDNEDVLTGMARPDGRRVFPIILNVGTYPVNPMSISYVEEQLKLEGLLQDPRIHSLSIIDISELEMLEGWAASGGPTMPEAIVKWKQSDLHQVSLRNFATLGLPGAQDLEWFSPDTRSDSDVVFESIIDRLNLRDGVAGARSEAT